MSASGWPTSAVPAEVEWSLVDNSVVKGSPTNGAVNTYSRPGNNRLKGIFRWFNLTDDARRGVLAAVHRLRGRSGRFYITDPTITLGGSFATSELITNSSFSTSSGWGASTGEVSLTADGELRITAGRGAPAAYVGLSSSVPVVPYYPHAFNGVWSPNRGAWEVQPIIGSTLGGSEYGTGSTYDEGARFVVAGVPYGSTAIPSIGHTGTVGIQAGDYWTIGAPSFSRCMLADGSPNLFTSINLNNVAWTKDDCTISGSHTDIYGDTNAFAIVEDGDTSDHYVRQSVTVAATVGLDYAAAVFAKAGIRDHIIFQIDELTGSTTLSQAFNLTAGTIGGTATGANWASLRSSICPMGNGWYLCTLIGRKTNSATSLQVNIFPSANGSSASYTGSDGANATFIFQPGIAQTSVAFTPGPSAGSDNPREEQTGSTLYITGAPASTSGLLIRGDTIEINAEMKRMIAPLNSDASGRGMLQFEPPLRVPVTHGTPVIVTNPMGRFLSGADEISWPTRNIGDLASDFTLEFLEAFTDT